MKMEWTSSFKKAIDYMEEHLLMDIGAVETAEAVHISSFHFQRAFKIMSGYSIGEYIRNRRLYLSGLEVIKSREKVIDIACKYGYDTPESFTKAFTRFHGVSPMQLREEPFKIKTFLPLTIEVTVKGGDRMDFTIEKMEPMKLIGFEMECTFDTSYREVPKFWDSFFETHMEGETQKVIEECGIGEFGICMDDVSKEKCRYLIAGIYHGGKAPEGMKVVEIDGYEWAKFPCVGAMPDAIQTVNTRIFREWLPTNPEYEIAANLSIEWYSGSDTQSPDYESTVWIPVKKSI